MSTPHAGAAAQQPASWPLVTAEATEYLQQAFQEDFEKSININTNIKTSKYQNVKIIWKCHKNKTQRIIYHVICKEASMSKYEVYYLSTNKTRFLFSLSFFPKAEKLGI